MFFFCVTYIRLMAELERILADLEVALGNALILSSEKLALTELKVYTRLLFVFSHYY